MERLRVPVAELEEINLDNLGEKGRCSTRKGDALFHADDIIIAAA